MAYENPRTKLAWREAVRDNCSMEEKDWTEVMRSDWNQRAREDAYYYVAFARPNQNEAEFEDTASIVLPWLEAELVRLAERNSAERRALEIGCGPGRLMVAMAPHFGEIHGVDVSDEMIRLATDRLVRIPKAHAHINNGQDLALFGDDSFDFVYSYVVFQHIPSKQVVLNYVRESQRVLKPGGVFAAQFRGSAKPVEEGQWTTWRGCSFSGGEIREFARALGFQLVSISGEGTQYMSATLRRARVPSPGGASLLPRLHAVTGTSGTEASVPAWGRRSAISLWLSGLTDTVDLNSFSVAINGEPAINCYLSPIGEAGAAQMNALLPRGLQPGVGRVIVFHDGELLGELPLEITPAPPRQPRVTSLTDAVNLLSKRRIESGSLKIGVEDVADPEEVTFQIGGITVEPETIECLDPRGDEYFYTLPVGARIPPGVQLLTSRVVGVPLSPIEIEVLR